MMVVVVPKESKASQVNFRGNAYKCKHHSADAQIPYAAAALLTNQLNDQCQLYFNENFTVCLPVFTILTVTDKLYVSQPQ